MPCPWNRSNGLAIAKPSWSTGLAIARPSWPNGLAIARSSFPNGLEVAKSDKPTNQDRGDILPPVPHPLRVLPSGLAIASPFGQLGLATASPFGQLGLAIASSSEGP